MGMLLTIAWRNIWRNQKRSLILLLAIAFGLWAGLYASALSVGMIRDMVDAAIATRISHVQIHAPEFLRHRRAELALPEGPLVASQIEQMPGVKAISARLVLAAMASSPTTASGVELYGIDPAREERATDLAEHLIEGTWFETTKRHPIVIGAKLARRLGVKLGAKIVLTAQTPNGDLASGAFRLVGIYQTVASAFDETAAFALRSDVERTFDLRGQLHEIAVLLEKGTHADAFAAELKALYPRLEVASWRELAPELAMSNAMMDESLFIFLLIILLALAFGIANAMLMAIVERRRELGLAMALGMKGSRIFAMVLLESLFLSLIGAAAGIGLGALAVHLTARRGLDLSLFAEGFSEFGMSSFVYPYLAPSQYPAIVALVVITALGSALYPAYKAVKLRPADALRTF